MTVRRAQEEAMSLTAEQIERVLAEHVLGWGEVKLACRCGELFLYAMDHRAHVAATIVRAIQDAEED